MPLKATLCGCFGARTKNKKKFNDEMLVVAQNGAALKAGNGEILKNGVVNDFQRFEEKMNIAREQWERENNGRPDPTALNTNCVPPANAQLSALNNSLIPKAIATSYPTSGSLRPSKKRTFHVRALFDYDPSRDTGLPNRGLPFCFGDVLHVVNASDDEWWQARRVNPSDGQEEGMGIIPSKQRVIKKEKHRLKCVSFHANIESSSSDVLRTNKKSTFSRKLGLASRSKELVGDSTSGGTASDSASDQESIHTATGEVIHIKSYEPLVLAPCAVTRPVVILGATKERLDDDLITQYAERFGSCIPHTTREQRPGEVDGKDYHFVPSREQMESDIQNGLFIEAGQYNENLYGTSTQAVLAVAAQGKHCVLDVSGAAIKRLRANNMNPIVIGIRAKSIENMCELTKRIDEEQALRELEAWQRLEDDYSHLFTAIVQADTYDEIYARVKEVIYRESGETCWQTSIERI